MLCAICDDRSPYAGLVCNYCRVRLARALWNLVDLYEELGSHVEARNVPSAIGPVSGTKERKTPLNLDVMDLLGPANRGTVTDNYDDQTGNASVLSVLVTWVDDWCEYLNLSLPPVTHLVSVGKVVVWLSSHVQDACDRFVPIAEFASEINELNRQMRRAMSIRATRIRYQGLCSNCQNTTLILNRDDGIVICPSCDSEFGVEELAKLSTPESRQVDSNTPRAGIDHTTLAVNPLSVFTCDPGKPCPESGELISVTTAAQLLGISKQRFNGWASRKNLDYQGLGPRGNRLYRSCCVVALGDHMLSKSGR